MAVDPGDDTDEEDPQSWNLYRYSRNNPVAFMDPDGQEPISITIATGAVLATAAVGYLVSPSPYVPGKTNGEVLGQSILDAAAAIGGAINHFAQRGPQYYGTDDPRLVGKTIDELQEMERQYRRTDPDFFKKIKRLRKWLQEKAKLKKVDVVPPEQQDHSENDPADGGPKNLKGGITTQPKGPLKQIPLPKEPTVKVSCKDNPWAC